MPCRPGRAATLLVAVVVLALAGSACTVDPDRTRATTTPAEASDGPVVPSSRQEDQRRRLVQETLDRYVAAVLSGDRTAFLAQVDHSDRDFVARQKRWFANLQELPLATLGLTVVDNSWPSDFADRRWKGTAYIPYVEQRMQLAGFEDRPVTTVHGLTFARVRGRWLLVADRDVAHRNVDGSQEAPWDLTSVDVVESDRVLGIFDKGSRQLAPRILRWTETAIDAVSDGLPVQWDERVVLYAVSDPGTLRTFGRLFGDFAAIAFPVYENNMRYDSPVAEHRVVVNPDALPRRAGWGRLLLTHELTHVAVGRERGRAPVWLEEGLAEYVAVREDARALEALASGSGLPAADTMPNSNTFYRDDVGVNYRMAVAVCAYIAREYGERALWDLFLAMKRTIGTASPDLMQDRVLRRELGLGSAELAKRASGVLPASPR